MKNFRIMNSRINSIWLERGRYGHPGRCIVSLLIALLMSFAPLSVSIAEQDGSGTRFESSNYLKGVEAYRAGEFRQAFDAWSLGAYEDDAESQYNLGVLYVEGRGVARNPVQARSWFLRAAEKNHAEAQYNLGHMSLSGLAVEKDMDSALEWWRRSAEAGYAQAQFNFGRALYLGISDEPDPISGLVFIRQAAVNGDSRAQEFLDENGLGVAAVATGEPDTETMPPSIQTGELDTQNAMASPDKQGAENGAGSDAVEDAIAVGDAVEPAEVEPTEVEDAGVVAADGDMPVSDHTPEIESSTAMIDAEPVEVSAAMNRSAQDSSLLADKAAENVMPKPDSVQGPALSVGPTVLIRQRDEQIQADVVAPVSVAAPAAENQGIFNPPALNIVRDEAPILLDYFLRTGNEDVPLFARINSSAPIETLAGKTLLRVRTVDGDKLQVDAITRREVWVLALGIYTTDGLAVSNGNLVPMFDQPGGRQIGVLPQYQAMLMLEQRKGWRKLSLSRLLSGWIDARSLAYSGETASQLKTRWEAGLKGLALSKQRQN